MEIDDSNSSDSVRSKPGSMEHNRIDGMDSIMKGLKKTSANKQQKRLVSDRGDIILSNTNKSPS